jgi:sulfur relay (sulfurtransferase) complex TusBCD TusD component (DsrE family)
VILPQLVAGDHGVEVVGMFFFDDNNYILCEGDPLGERLTRVAADQNILLMMCDQCALERGLDQGTARNATPAGTVANVQVGGFPDLYQALSGNLPDQVITL